MTRRAAAAPTRPTRFEPAATPAVYPFTAIVGQDEMKLALLLNAVSFSIGGVLIMGHRGTGKSTAVRALADLLPPIERVRDCVYGCDPSEEASLCANCGGRLQVERRLPRARARVRVVDLPLGATEDRVCGTINLERAMTEGVKTFEPGLLARANRGFLYIDEVNLLEDHLVDLLLDVSVSGRNRVEREGISAEHPARFVLVGSGNPEEGELRPQLVDRFGVCAEVRTAADVDERVSIVERREAFERDPSGFNEASEQAQASLRRRLKSAQRKVKTVEVPRALVRLIAELCQRLKIDGHRGELTITRAARALAALEGRRAASTEDVRRVAAMSLRHRMRRDPLEHAPGDARIEHALTETLGDAPPPSSANDEKKNLRHERDEKFPPDSNGGNISAGEPGKTSPRGEGTPRNPQNPRGEEQTVPPVEARLELNAPASPLHRVNHQRSQTTSTRRREGTGHSTKDARRGRYVGATTAKRDGASIALDATLRAAAFSQDERRSFARPRLFSVTARDFRYKRLRDKEGTLFIFAVDASGSMAANRIGQAKGALGHLLRRSYINRDRIALVSFRELDAAVLVPPSRAPSRAKRMLDALPVGGATPLAAGLLRALEIADRATRQGTRRIMLLVFTDGRANVSLRGDRAADRVARKENLKTELDRLGAALQRAGVNSTVIDTQNRFTAHGEGQALAVALGGRLVHLPSMATETALADALAVP